MKILGINGSFRLDMGWVFPTHPDFKLVNTLEEAQQEKNVDAFVQTNVRGFFKNLYKDQHDFIKSTGKPKIVIEQAPFRKNQDFDNPNSYYYKVGLNHFTYNEGIFKNENSPSDRWDKISKELDIKITPWRNKKYSDDQYILVLVQNPIDTSLNDLVSKMRYEEWLFKLIKDIQKITDKKILVRLHPRFLKRFTKWTVFDNFSNVKVSDNYDGFNKSNGGRGLYEDFKNAWCCVTYSSNSATEAICEGIPVVNLHESSFSWPVSFHSLDVLQNKQLNCNFERTQWLHDLSYTQWTLEEINSGIVHKRLLNDNNT